MNAVLKYVNRRLTQMKKDKASQRIVSDGERELLKVRKLLLKHDAEHCCLTREEVNFLDPD